MTALGRAAEGVCPLLEQKPHVVLILQVRHDGDEFMVVLPECPADKVDVVLSRVVAFEAEFEGKRFWVSSSLGRAQYQPPESVEDLMARADAALYEHKIALSRSVPGRKYGTVRQALKS